MRADRALQQHILIAEIDLLSGSRGQYADHVENANTAILEAAAFQLHRSRCQTVRQRVSHG